MECDVFVDTKNDGKIGEMIVVDSKIDMRNALFRISDQLSCISSKRKNKYHVLIADYDISSLSKYTNKSFQILASMKYKKTNPTNIKHKFQLNISIFDTFVAKNEILFHSFSLRQHIFHFYFSVVGLYLCFPISCIQCVLRTMKMK